MSKQKWPCWIELRYFRETDTSIMGYKGCANDANMLFEIIYRLNIGHTHVILMKSNDKILSEEEISAFFAWFEKNKREREENEKRKEADEKAKGTNKGSKSKSR